MSSTFTTPLRVFKRNNPTNDGTIAPDNTGAVLVSQQQFAADTTATTASATTLSTTKVGQTTASQFTIPAGSQIRNIYLYETTAPSALTGGVVTVSVGGTAVGTLTPTTSGGQIAISFTTSAAVAALLNNVGTSDVAVTFSQATVSAITGTLSQTFVVDYVARNLDGSINAYGSGYTNS
jgi:hypothetical protein